MKAECLALSGLLWVACQIYLVKIWVFGDSKVLIDHMNQKDNIVNSCLLHWFERIHTLKKFFSSITFSHIYREKNNEADSLSKKGLSGLYREIYCDLVNANGEGVVGKLFLF